MIRYAIIRNARSRSEVEAYLPDNFRVIHEYAVDDPRPSKNLGPDTPPNHWVIAGEDSAGWGLDTYVKPRFASGMIHTEEIDLSHPIMKEIPLEA